MDVIRQPGAAIGRDIAKGEAVEAELDAFISRRHEQCRRSEAEREAEAAFREAERSLETRRRAENRAGWYRGHMARAELYGRLSVEHAVTAKGLMEEN